MLYNIAIHFYMLGVAVAALFNRKVRTMWQGERRAFKELKEKVDATAQYVWFHAASLGEFEQGRPLMEQLRRDHPQYKILLTFFSPSGYEVRKNYAGADIVCYLPLDTRHNALRFLRLVNPVMAFFIKYEFWYNYLHVLKQRGTPVYSVSSIFRQGQIFFKWYGKSYAGVLRCFTHFYVQNTESKDLLGTLNIHCVTVAGDTRFDRVLHIREQAKQLDIIDGFTSDAPPVFVAGSSWQPDEDVFIPYFNQHPEWKVIIAPHVIGEDHLQQILSKVQGKAVRYTQTTPAEAADARWLIIDCFGLLSSAYRYGKVSYVGGGFGVGIHNVLEAAVWSIPVVFGPNNKRFAEAQELMAAGGGFEIHQAADFEKYIDRWAANEAVLKQAGEAAGRYVGTKTGATATILRNIHL